MIQVPPVTADRSTRVRPDAKWSLLFAVLALAVSCGGPRGPRAGDELLRDPVADSRVRFADDLRGLVKIESVRSERVPYSNALKVYVPIRNVSGRDLQLQVMCEFLDDGGNPYQDETARKPLFVPRNSTKTWVAASMQPRASEYVVHLWRYQKR